MPKPWHSINAPGFPRAAAKADATAVNIEYSAPPAAEKPAAEVRFESGEFAPHPLHGYGFNKKCLVRARASFLRSTIRTRVEFTMRAVYDGREQDLGVFVDGNLDSDGGVEVEIPLYYHDDYHRDERDNALKGPVRYFVTATHSRHKAPLEIGPLEMPCESDPPLLRRGRYDDRAVERYESREAGDEGHLSGTPVLALQRTLERFRFSPGPVDGDFGAKTERAVKEFQAFALEERRRIAGDGDIVEVEPGFGGPVDGVVGPATREEIRVWDMNHYVNPSLILAIGDFDDHAHRAGLRDRRAEEERDYYRQGGDVKALQRDLLDLEFDEVGTPDGDFGERTREAMKAFQEEAALRPRWFVAEKRAVEAPDGELYTGGVTGRCEASSRDQIDRWRERGWRRAEEPIPEDAAILYLPGEESYLIVEAEHIDALLEEVEAVDGFARKIAAVVDEVEGGAGGPAALEKTEELDKEAREIFGGTPAESIEELLVLRHHKEKRLGSSQVYIRKHRRKSGEVRGHLRRNSDRTVKKKLKEMFDGGGEGEHWMDKHLREKLLSGNIDGNWPNIWLVDGKHNVGGSFAAGTMFSGSAEAQWLRYAAGGSIEAGASWKSKKVTFSAHGNAEYLVGEGTVNGELCLPDNDGGDLLGLLRKSDGAAELITDDRVCRFRLRFGFKGVAFVGAAASATLAFPNIQLGGASTSDTDTTAYGRKLTADGEAGVDLFAGATAGGEITPSIEWADRRLDFQMLGAVRGGLEGSAGAGVQLKAEIGYKDGKFRVLLGVRAVVGLGGKGNIGFEGGVEEVFELVAYLFNSVEFHRIDDVVADAFKAYTAYSIGRIVKAGELVGDAAREVIEELWDFDSWLGGLVRFPERQEAIKRRVRRSVQDPARTEPAPPEALGKVLRAIMAVPEDGDFEAIEEVLRSAKSKHELLWIVRRVATDGGLGSAGEKEDAFKAGFRRLMDFRRDIPESANYRTNVANALDDWGIRYEAL